MSPIKQCIKVAGYLLVALTSQLAAAGVEVFSASHIELLNVPEQTVVAELDTMDGLDYQASRGLPDDQPEAEQLMLQRMRSGQWQQLERSYQHAAMAVARAWMLGIQKLPAVVMDGSVVYGERDITAAIEMIEEARNGL